MTEDDRRLNAIVEGYLAGTLFRLAERLDITWRELIAMTFDEVRRQLTGIDLKEKK
jgi:hypothetical protein